MNYLVMIGSDMFYGTNGILTVEIEDKIFEFFRIKEIYRIRSEGSYLAIDCDIKDQDNNREIKLFKSKPVSQNQDVSVVFNKKETIAKRADDSIILKVEQVELNNVRLIDFDPVKKLLDGFPKNMVSTIENQLEKITIDAVIKITGNFNVGKYHLVIDDAQTLINGTTISGNLMIGTGGIKLLNNSLALG